MKNQVLTKGLDDYFTGIYRAAKFVARFFRQVVQSPFDFREIVRQCYSIGYKSLPLITLTGFVVGMVFTKQSRPSLLSFGATSWLPSLIGIALLRALASLVTALISAGKVGSGIGAELASMRVTEQIDAMEVSATDPFKFLVVTRVVASTLMIPILSFYCGFMGLMGSCLNVYQHEKTNFMAFINAAFEQLLFLDLNTSIVKSIAFGFTIGIVGSYKGWYAEKGTLGVGKAANEAVVVSMFLIFLEELIIVQLSGWVRNY